MPQFDLYHIDGHGFVVDCQCDLLSDLRSRIVAPLRTDGESSVSMSRLNPRIDVDGRPYRLATQFLRSVDVRQLGKPVGSVAEHEYDIKAALDMLISGF